MTAARRSACDLPAAVLALGCVRHYLWPFADVDAQSSVYKIGAAVCVAGLAYLLWLREPSRMLACVMALFAFEELQVVIAEVWWLVDPWDVPDGKGVMESRTGLSTVTLCMVALAWLAIRLSPVRSDSGRRVE